VRSRAGVPGVNAPGRTDIYVVRHAHVHNPDDILYGRLPRFHLSELGWKQASELGAFLAGRPIEAIYSSPLLRARQTAAAIAQSLPHVPVRGSSLILEVRTGYQGQPNSLMKPGFSFYEPLVNESDESMEAVYARISRFLRRAARLHVGGAIVAVTHADPIAIMRLGLLKMPLTVQNLHSTVYPARASINLVTLTPDNDPVLTYFNVSGDRI
jgi:broad specificity phosphatase PhoE